MKLHQPTLLCSATETYKIAACLEKFVKPCNTNSADVTFSRTCRLSVRDQHAVHRRRLDRVGLPEAKRQPHEAARSHPGWNCFDVT